MEASLSKVFSRLSTILLENPATWEGKIFLTFDIDWAHDQVLSDTIDLVEQANVEATWFVTHDTPLLDRMRANPKFELGIHPNFNFLLNGDARNGRTPEEVLDRLLQVVPEAKSVRCHSMTQNSNLLHLFWEKGLTHDSNHYIPEESKIELKPWEQWTGILKVPYFWEDDVFCLNKSISTITQLTQRSGLRVFDFHPIHVFLNTEDMNRYERSRGYHQNPSELIGYRNNGNKGVRDFLAELISRML